MVVGVDGCIIPVVGLGDMGGLWESLGSAPLSLKEGPMKKLLTKKTCISVHPCL